MGSTAGEASGSSSIRNLLMNIQCLLKVAVENARHHEQQTNYEKGGKLYDVDDAYSCYILLPSFGIIIFVFIVECKLVELYIVFKKSI